MGNSTSRLVPFSRIAALITGISVMLVGVTMLAVLKGWPTAQSEVLVLTALFVAGIIPLAPRGCTPPGSISLGLDLPLFGGAPYPHSRFTSASFAHRSQ